MCVFAVVEMTPPAIANIDWRVFVIFAVFNALWVPLVYAFFPETRGLELEDVDHIFEKGGITGGVWSSPGGRTVERRRIARDVEERKAKGGGEGEGQQEGEKGREKGQGVTDVRVEDARARAGGAKGDVGDD